jgi:hypothetical protein
MNQQDDLGLPTPLWVAPEPYAKQLSPEEYETYCWNTMLRNLRGHMFSVMGRVSVMPIPQKNRKKIVNAFLSKYHSHCGGVQGWTDVLGICDDLSFFGVLVMGYPVARKLNDNKTLEVRRLALMSNAPKNSASMLLGRAERIAKAKGFSQLISYTLASEDGISYQAAGWTEDSHVVQAQTWSRSNRKRKSHDIENEIKHRWRKILNDETHIRLPYRRTTHVPVPRLDQPYSQTGRIRSNNRESV